MHISSMSRFVIAGLVVLSIAGAASASSAPIAGNYQVDPIHSSAFFEVGHAGGISRFVGRFNDISGDLVVDTPEKSKVNVSIKVDSVDTNHDGLDKHLKSPDFFSAVQFPTMNFTSTALNLNTAGEGILNGNLTLHGVTKPVSFKLKYIGTGNGPKGDTRVGYVATAAIKRSDFGMSFGVPKAATDEVELRVNIEAVKR